ncbi:T9SS type B sorting domain-containing protein [Flaviramulus sp. BrNp1-15]|uniref:T9SS type B sorting domain-containing protein n=1 Tax=Flaviramulus sp. BrNp1-15 TaxID=2916754 RepID=UPI001EE958FD|nr:T9SS type B sorting domain-containing protein [Flaviramulus sp. BrNp1-15]ULC58662.1 T9SS type B sorting domain-containing protein [Flaviramulus sp. BrNp1-15]
MRKYLLFSFIIISTSIFCQNETNNWYFGEKAGLYFELQENPQVLFDSNMISTDACATISDRDGNLQFYTNGINVWNKNHTIMINGVLLEPLGGGVDPTQLEPDVLLNVIIVPITDRNNMYYIFTVTSSSGLRYSVIDMNLNNGSGEIVDKNRDLLAGIGIGKLSAVHHTDGKSIWLMSTRKNDNDEYTSFYAYKINTDGSIDNPIITDNLFYKGLQEGVMKFSPDGKRIACANYRPQELSDHLMIFDFDSANGIVNNKRNLLTSFTFFEVVSAYGVEFSNDSKYLYVSLIRQGMFTENSTDFQPETIRKNILYQYDLANPNPQQNATSLHEEVSELSAGSLQLAKNGKIYRALSISDTQGTEFLGEIISPENFGVDANYVNNVINLTPNKSRLGLPTFIQSYFRTRILAENGCLGISMPFEVDTYADIASANWDFGDGNISNQINPQHTYTNSGNFTVTANININNRNITVTKKVRVHELPNLIENQELIQCDNDTDGISIFNLYNIRDKITNPILNEDLFFYEKRIDADQDVNRIPNPEVYTNTNPNQEIFIRVVNQNNCYEISSFFLYAVFVDLGNISEMYACGNLDTETNNVIGRFPLADKRDDIRSEVNLTSSTNLRFFPTLLDAQTTQNEITARFYNSISSTIWVRAEENDLKCTGIAPISLFVNSYPVIDLDDTYIICNDVPVFLSGDSFNDRFEWINSNNDIVSTKKDFNTTIPDTYTHIAYRTENNIECSNSKSFTVTKIDLPVFDRIETIDLSNDNKIHVSILGNEIYEFSINNSNFSGRSNEYTFHNVPAGINNIYVRDFSLCNNIIQKQIFVLGYPKFFTPNNDGVNDLWGIIGVNKNMYESMEVIIFNRYGKLVAVLDNKNKSYWDGTNNGEKLPSTDYWFTIKFITKDNSIVKKNGHFSLIR